MERFCGGTPRSEYDYESSITERCLESISQFPGLESLTLKLVGGMVNDFRALQHCKSLRTLRIKGDASPVYSSLASLQQLTHLVMTNTKWMSKEHLTESDFQAVCTLTNLRSLQIDYPFGKRDLSCSELSAISAMSKLETLWVNVCSLPEITPHLLTLPNNNLRFITYEAKQAKIKEKRCEVQLKKRFPGIQITQLQPVTYCRLC